MTIIIGLINGMFSATTPILLAALGGTLTYYAGIFNIAMEGMMLVGAFFAVVGSYYFNSWPLGILTGIAGAILIAFLFILFAIVLHVDEFITGVGLNLFSTGLTTYLLRQIFGVKGAFTSLDIVPVPSIDLPIIEAIPIFGDVLSGHNLLLYLTIILTIFVNYLIFRTRFGLRLRAAGYNRTSLDTSGVSSKNIRVWSLLLCAVLCGLAGAYLSIGYVTLFSKGMSAGRGWISLAAIILVSGNPIGIALISLIFGLTDGIGLLMQAKVPSQFTSMLPYIATLVALFVYSIRAKRKNINKKWSEIS